jgi:hypothetical protein
MGILQGSVDREIPLIDLSNTVKFMYRSKDILPILIGELRRRKEFSTGVDLDNILFTIISITMKEVYDSVPGTKYSISYSYYLGGVLASDFLIIENLPGLVRGNKLDGLLGEDE